MFFNSFIPKAHTKATERDDLAEYFFGRITLLLQEVLSETCNFLLLLTTH